MKLHLFVLALSILTVALTGIFHVKVNKTEGDVTVAEDATKIEGHVEDIDQKLDAIEGMMEREKDGLDNFLNDVHRIHEILDRIQSSVGID